MPVNFFAERIRFHLQHKKIKASWIERVVKKEGFVPGNINIVFCSDRYLLSLNKKYLHRNYLTDVITFDLSEVKKRIEGDIFVSLPRIRENSGLLGTARQDELDRVIIHGILHLIGYADKTTREKRLMRKKEDAYLSLRQN